MQDQLAKIKKDFAAEYGSKDADFLHQKYLGRKSALSNLLRSLSSLPLQQRKALGEEANLLRQEIVKKISERSGDDQQSADQIDVTLPGTSPELGRLHPITLVEREFRKIFERLGFISATGPEVELDYYNFEALNIPKGHPARDMHDTFYVAEHPARPKFKVGTLLLRTHISPMQIRVLEKHQPPLAVISSGRVFRHEATDARHEHTWDYMEGFAVGSNLSLGHLKFVLDKVLKEFFGSNLKTLLRPSFFPFVEPGVEVAMTCLACGGKGCKVCTTGWLEMLGAGMIHPNLFAAAGYPTGKFTGFAFGLGLSRFAMMKYNIPDIRLLYKNDFRYLKNY